MQNHIDILHMPVSQLPYFFLKLRHTKLINFEIYDLINDKTKLTKPGVFWGFLSWVISIFF